MDSNFRFVVALCLQSEKVAGGGRVTRKGWDRLFHFTRLEPVIGPDEWPFSREKPILIRLKGTTGGVLEEGGLYVVEVPRPLRQWKGVVWTERVIAKIN